MKSILFRVVVVTMLVAWPAGAQPLADRVPGDALLYIGWNGTTQMPSGYDQTHLKAVLDSSRVRELITDFLPAVIARAANEPGAGPMPAQMGAVRSLLTQIWTKPTAFVFGGMDLTNPRSPMPRLALICAARNEAPQMVQQLQALLAMAPQARLSVQDVGGLVVLSIGYAQAADALAATNGSLAQAPAFVSALKQVQANPMLICYADTERLISNIETLLLADGNPQAQAMVPKVIDALGIRGLKRIISTSGFDGRDWMSQTFVEAPAPRTGLLQLYNGQPLSADLLKSIPADSTFAASFRFDPARVLTSIREAVGKVDPQAQVMFDQGMGAVQIALARNLITDILEPLGPDWAMYCSPSVAGNGVLGVVVVNKLDDPDKAQLSLPMAATNLSNWASVALRRAQAPVQITGQTTMIGEQRVHYVGSPIIAPAFTIKDGYLFMALYPQPAAAGARWPARGQKSLAENEKFVALQRRLAVSNPVSFSFYDLQTTATHSGIYQQLMVIARYGGLGDMFGVPLPEPLLPPLDALSQHLAPAGSMGWVDDAGYHVKSISPFPGSRVFSEAGMMSTAGVGGTAMGISILLPSLNRARETANRVKCAANLKSMGQGLLLYANENRGRLPATLGELVKTQEMTADVFVCPSGDNEVPEALRLQGVDAQAAWVDANADYVYLGRGRNFGLGADQILIYEKPGNHDQEGINVLFGDGHVDFVRMPQAMQMIERQGAGRGR